MRYRLCQIDEVPRGTKKAFSVKNVPIVLTHSAKDEFYAIYGLCPHQHASLADGALVGLTIAEEPGDYFRTEREGEIIRCAWHGFSYDARMERVLQLLSVYGSRPTHLLLRSTPFF